MLLGKTTSAPLAWPPAEGSEGAKDLFHLALGWLKEDKVVRKEREKVTGRIRGPKAEVSSLSILLPLNLLIVLPFLFLLVGLFEGPICSRSYG